MPPLAFWHPESRWDMSPIPKQPVDLRAEQRMVIARSVVALAFCATYMARLRSKAELAKFDRYLGEDVQSWLMTRAWRGCALADIAIPRIGCVKATPYRNDLLPARSIITMRCSRFLQRIRQ